jgi:hypothetical protein
VRKIDRQQEDACADHVAGHEHRGLRESHLATWRAHLGRDSLSPELVLDLRRHCT